jgi:hypothetical protein
VFFFFFFFFSIWSCCLVSLWWFTYWAKKTNNQELVETVSTIIWTKIDLRFSFLTKRLFINQSIVGFQWCTLSECLGRRIRRRKMISK